MSKLVSVTLILVVLGCAGSATNVSPGVASAGAGCHRTTFETALIRDACQAGGQAEAKKAMKAFVKQAKQQESSLECRSCHSSLAPEYPLKADGLQHFHDLGGN